MILGYLATLTRRLSFLNLLAQKIGLKVYERDGGGEAEKEREQRGRERVKCRHKQRQAQQRV